VHQCSLALLTIVAAIWTAMGFARLTSARDHAAAARSDLEICRGYLTELAQAGSSPRAVSSSDPAELNRRIHSAAQASGVAEKLTNVEPYAAARVESSDYQEMQVALRLESLTMRDLITFLHQLTSSDAASRVKVIELESPGQSEPGQSAEAWTADVTMAYLIYSPRPAE
jgi:hypothetical protein